MSEGIVLDCRTAGLGLRVENSGILKKTLLQNNHDEELLVRPHIWRAGGQVCLF